MVNHDSRRCNWEESFHKSKYGDWDPGPHRNHVNGQRDGPQHNMGHPDPDSGQQGDDYEVHLREVRHQSVQEGAQVSHLPGAKADHIHGVQEEAQADRLPPEPPDPSATGGGCFDSRILGQKIFEGFPNSQETVFGE